MSSVSMSAPNANNMACPNTLVGRYSLQGFTHPPPHLLGGSGGDPPPIPPPPIPPPPGPSPTIATPIITVTFKKESDNTAKDYPAVATPDMSNGTALATGGWTLTKPTDLVSGQTYTITATLGTADCPRTGITA